MTLGFVIALAIAGILVPFNAAAAPHSASKPKLSFGDNGKFKVVVFADLHYGEAPEELWGPEQDRKSDIVMSKILDAEKPDLVVYLGDLVTANNVATKNATEYWRQATSPAARRNIPWASVFGNHDDTAFEWPPEWFGPSGIPGASQAHYTYFQGTTRAELMASETNETMSVTSEGPESLWPSVSNFFLNISSSKSGSPAAIFYFLDSGGGSYPEVISASQAAWFQKLSTAINPHNKVPELAFWHIPSKAYESVAPPPKAPISSPCVGSINLDGGVASQTAEWGVMDVLGNRTSVKAVIVGHNHGNDWCCPKGSLWLCFARHTGYGGYGDWAKGARVIELSEDSVEAKTWVRLEDGSVLNAFELSTSDHSAH